MQAFSNPIHHCSTVVGRSFLEWYGSIQDYCCFSAAYIPPLPRTWRDESIRIRQALAHDEYPRLSPKERLPRLLDDLWAQLRALLPQVSDVQAAIVRLRSLEGQERIDLASRLEKALSQVITDLTGFLASRHVLEVFTPAPTVLYPMTHATCCPSPPFSPHICELPAAGYLRVVFHGLLAYLRGVLHPFLLAELGTIPKNFGVMGPDGEFHATELCRSFAGIEQALGFIQGSLYPCFPGMVSAALTCPPTLREWVWCKLLHFTSAGQFKLEPIKTNLAITWNMPEILSKEFSWKTESRSDRRIVELNEIDITVNMEKVSLQGGSPSSDEEEDDGLESLTRLRGLFGITRHEPFSEGIEP